MPALSSSRSRVSSRSAVSGSVNAVSAARNASKRCCRQQPALQARVLLGLHARDLELAPGLLGPAALDRVTRVSRPSIAGLAAAAKGKVTMAGRGQDVPWLQAPHFP